MQFNVKHNLKAKVPAEKIWELIGQQFDSVGHWASGVSHSTGKKGGIPFEGSDFTGRTCETVIGAVDETITSFDNKTMNVSYRATASAMPFFVKHLHNRWNIDPVNDTSCQIFMHLTVELMPVIGHLMTPLMKIQMNKLTRESVEELIYFAETGLQHQRKLTAGRKLKPSHA